MFSRSSLWSYPFAVESSQVYDGVSSVFLCIPLAFLSFSVIMLDHCVVSLLFLAENRALKLLKNSMA